METFCSFASSPTSNFVLLSLIPCQDLPGVRKAKAHSPWVSTRVVVCLVHGDLKIFVRHVFCVCA